MTYNFNINPYYDDYSDDKNFYRILFKPGRAVQARELTQLQTILQRQISRFGNHIFKEGSVVSDANFVLDDSAFYIKCESQYQGQDVDFSTIEGRYIIESSTGRIGLVKKFVAATETDPPTIYASIVDGEQLKFNDGETFSVVASATSTEVLFSFISVGSSSSGESLLFSVSEGVFYTKETFVYNEAQTVVLGKYSKIASYIVGFNVVETVVESTTDTSLLDPALGSSNYLAPGADRYKIELVLTTQTYTDEAVAYENFIEIASVRNGYLESDKRRPVYDELGDTLARRTYDESGDYIVRNFVPKLYDNANNDNQLVLEISAGKAYVRGYEIETISPTFLDVRKSRDTELEDNYQLITPQGNYTYVSGLIGSLPNINGNTFVEIHNATTDLSSNTLIGTAFIRNLEYTGGTGNTSIYAVFLRDILFSASSFDTAKCFVVPNGTDYVTPILKANIDASAIIDGKAQIYETFYNKSIFNLPQNYIKTNANTAYTYKQKFTVTVSSGTASITGRVGDTLFSASQETTKRELYSIVNVTTGEFIPLENTSITITASDNSATIDFGTSQYDGDTIDVIATVETTNDSRRVKTLVTNFNKSISVANTSPISLLKSDIYELKAVYELSSNQTYVSNVWSSGTTYSANDVVLYANTAYVSLENDNLNNQPDTSANSWESLVNSIGYYSLDNGQRDNTYEHGSIQRRSQPLSTLNAIVVFDYFTHSGSGHLSSNSYPISVGLSNIPNYTSKTDNTQFRIRDCIDFRPRRNDDTANLVYSFCQVPRGFTNVTTDVEYFLRRIDKVILTKNGNFKVIEGVSSLIDPKPPAGQDDSITLFILTFEPYTDRIEDVGIKILPYRRYTMKDIGDLDDRLSRVEFYTSLSILEKEVEGKSFTDDNGDQLFKNGFLVDSFKGHNIGDVTNPDYRCSIDYTNGILRPLYESFNLPLTIVDADTLNLTEFTNDTAAVNSSDIVTLPYTSNVYVNQPLASSWSSLNPFDLISFTGTLEITPTSDVWYDEQTLPDVIINKDGENDNYKNFLSVSTQWNAWETLWSGEKKLEDRVEVVGDRQITKTKYELTQQQTRSGTEILKAPPSVVLSKTTNIVSQSALPYARSADLRFKVTGLAPNTKLYLYIDGKNMSNYLYDRNIFGGFTANSSLPNGVTTDNTGSAIGIIKFPNNDFIKFLSGNKRVILCDQPFDYKISTSYAETEFFSQGTLQTKQSTIVSTRGDYTVRKSLSDNRTISTVSERVTNDQPWYDPNLPDAIYSLTPSKEVVTEGETVTFVFSGQFVPSGRTYIANISGNITSSNVAGVTPNVPFGITNSGTFSRNSYEIKVPIINDGLVRDNKFITCTVQVPRDNVYPRFGGPLTLTSNVTILEASAPSFRATAPTSVQAGQNVVVTFTATNLQPSSNIPISYNVSGTILSTEYGSNSNSGSFIVNVSSNVVSLTFNTSPTMYSSSGFKTFDVKFNTPSSVVDTKTRIINPAPVYIVSANPSVVSEGDPIRFIVDTEFVEDGNTINYIISGVSSANINGASLTGTATILNKKAFVDVLTTDDFKKTSDKNITFRITQGLNPQTNTTTALIKDFGNPTFKLSSNTSLVSEGNTVIIKLETTKVPANTNVSYSISGVQADDYTGTEATGNLTIGTNGVAFLAVTANNEGVAESPEVFRLSLTNPSGNVITSGAVGNNIDITFVDSGIGTPVYSLTASSSTVEEGSDVTFTLKTLNVAAGNTVLWKISGIEAADLSSPASLSGRFVISSNGTAHQTITISPDVLAEGNQLLIFEAVTPSGNLFANTTILDTSVPPTISVRPFNSLVREGESVYFLVEGKNIPKTTPEQRFTFDLQTEGKTLVPGRNYVVEAVRNNIGGVRVSSNTRIINESIFDVPGTYTWTAPAGVTSVSVVCIGGGAGGGGGLGWKNNISVTPGTSYNVVVGSGTSPTLTAGNSYFDSVSTVAGFGAVNIFGGGFVGDGGGHGGDGVAQTWPGTPGGGAGGYNGRGGKAGITNGESGTGGGGAGGGSGSSTVSTGGGTGIYGQGNSGIAPQASGGSPWPRALGGSGGQPGELLFAGQSVDFSTGSFGGGGAIWASSSRNGRGGAVRIIWGGNSSFPFNATDNLTQLEWNGTGSINTVLTPTVVNNKQDVTKLSSTFGDTGSALIGIKFLEDFTTEGTQVYTFNVYSQGSVPTKINGVTQNVPFNITSNTKISVLDTSLTKPQFTITGPGRTIYEGEIIDFYVTANNLLANTTVDWSITTDRDSLSSGDINGVFLTAGSQANNTGTITITGEKNWDIFVDINPKVLTLYNDANASIGIFNSITNRSVTQLFAQQYPGVIWATAGDQYNSWLRNDEWRKKAEAGKVVFGQWYYEKYGRNDSTLIVPLASQVTGRLPVRNDGTPSRISLVFKEDGTLKSAGSTLTLNIANQSINVVLKGNTFVPDYSRFAPDTKKLVGTGDFLDSRLTAAIILGDPTKEKNSLIYFTDGKTQLNTIINDPAFAGKIALSSSEYRSLNSLTAYGTAVLTAFRDPTKLNRNPTVGEFIYWVKYLIVQVLEKDSPRSPLWFEAVGDPLATSSPLSYTHASMLNYGCKLSDADAVPGGQSGFAGLLSGLVKASNTQNSRFRYVPSASVQSKLGTTKGLYRFWYSRYSTVAMEASRADRGHASTYYINGKQVAKDLGSYSYQWKYVDVEIDPSIGFILEIITTQNEGGSEGCNRMSHHPYVFGFVFTTTSVTSVPARSNSLLHSLSTELKGPQDLVYQNTSGYIVSTKEVIPFNNAVQLMNVEIEKWAAKAGEKFNTRASFLACTTDPLAQTFFVSGANYPNGIFLDSVSLYFRAKDDKLPVFAEIRPTENGYPSASKTIPLSTVWKNHFEINISQDATAETNFKFKSPIYLPPGEYAIVTGSNSSKYFAFVAGIGEPEIRTGNIISEQPYVGSLFKSQNATTWTAEQKQDLCFKLYKCTFDTGNTALLFATNENPNKVVEYQTFKLTSEELDVSEETSISYELLTSSNGVIGTNFTPILSNKNTNLKTTKDSRSNNDTILKVALSSTNPDLTPVVDGDRLSLIAVKNIIGRESDVIVSEELPQGGNSLAKYITRSVTLAEGFDADKLRVIFDINRPIGTSVKVYYKVKAGDDEDDFDNKYYQEIEMVPKTINFTTNENQFVIDEYIASDITYESKGVTYYNFKTFAIKIVMYSENPAYVPQIKNLRVIALT